MTVAGGVTVAGGEEGYVTVAGVTVAVGEEG